MPRTDSRSTDALTPAFRERLDAMGTALAVRGVTMIVYCSTRSPETQARFWRQSRSGAEVRAAVAMLRAEGADYLAAVLDGVGPHHGPWRTDALPGLSWHQWGEAADLHWLVDGRAEWSDTWRDARGINGYRIMRLEAVKAGLYIGPRVDWPHIQGQPGGRPKGSLDALDAAMQAAWA